MKTADWTHTDEERSIEYQAVLHYEVDEGKIQIIFLDLMSVIDWFYDPEHGVRTEYTDDDQTVRKWLLMQIRESQPVRESAEEACQEEYEDHLEVLREKSQGII